MLQNPSSRLTFRPNDVLVSRSSDMPFILPRTPTYFIVVSLLCGCGLFLSGAYLPMAPQWQALGCLPTVTMTTLALLAGFEGAYFRAPKAYYFDILLKAMVTAGAIVCSCIMTFGIFVGLSSGFHRDEWFIIVTLGVLLGIYAFIISIPISLTYALVRRHFRNEPPDNYIHCRKCDFRVGNLVGPRCPECGTPIAGIIERDND